MVDYSYGYFCPICGKGLAVENDSLERICASCEKKVTLVKTKHPYMDYLNRANKDFKIADKIIVEEEISKNPLYNEKIAQIVEEKWEVIKKDTHGYYPAEIAKMNQPKCPTCQSTNIERISATSKVVGAALFGLFSTTAKSQFKCKYCGYKW